MTGCRSLTQTRTAIHDVLPRRAGDCPPYPRCPANLRRLQRKDSFVLTQPKNARPRWGASLRARRRRNRENRDQHRKIRNGFFALTTVCPSSSQASTAIHNVLPRRAGDCPPYLRNPANLRRLQQNDSFVVILPKTRVQGRARHSCARRRRNRENRDQHPEIR